MVSSQYWLAVAAYLVPTFPLGYFWHLSIFKARYDQLEMFRPDVLIPLGLTSMVLQALIFAWAYPRVFPGWNFAEGSLGAFVVFGLLSWSFVVLPVAAKYNMTSVPAFMTLETVFVIIQFAIISPLVALAYST
jgi:hypothetical protein